VSLEGQKHHKSPKVDTIYKNSFPNIFLLNIYAIFLKDYRFLIHGGSNMSNIFLMLLFRDSHRINYAIPFPYILYHVSNLISAKIIHDPAKTTKQNIVILFVDEPSEAYKISFDGIL
jgi:hypothetical protein